MKSNQYKKNIPTADGRETVDEDKNGWPSNFIVLDLADILNPFICLNSSGV